MAVAPSINPEPYPLVPSLPQAAQNKNKPALYERHLLLENNLRVITSPLGHVSYMIDLSQKLGSGNYATVYSAKATIQNKIHQFAIKISHLPDKQFQQYTNVQYQEEKHLRQFNTPYIIKLIEGFSMGGQRYSVFDRLFDNLYSVQQVQEGKNFPLHEIRLFASQLLMALLDLKASNIIHTDLKPENVLFTQRKGLDVCLADFGSAEIPNPQLPLKSRQIQPLVFQAPEVSLGFPYTCAIDMWSLGCLLAELMSGHSLFKIHRAGNVDKDNQALLLSIAEKHSPISQDILEASCFADDKTFIDHILSFKEERLLHTLFNTHQLEDLEHEQKVFFDLIKNMLAIDPLKRIEPECALNHPFITND